MVTLTDKQIEEGLKTVFPHLHPIDVAVEASLLLGAGFGTYPGDRVALLVVDGGWLKCHAQRYVRYLEKGQLT